MSMKNYETKEAKKVKDKVVLVCIREGVIPRLGAWLVGDRLEGAEAEALKGHPNFKVETKED